MTQLDDTLHRLAEIPAMWKKAHDDTLAPRGTDLTSGVSRSQPGSRQPSAADWKGWESCLWIARNLLIALHKADTTSRTPPLKQIGQPSNPFEVQQICDSLAVHLRASPATKPKRHDLDEAIKAVNRAHDELEWTNAQAHRPKPVTCETSGCTNGWENGRRCWRCTKYKRRNGDYPTVARAS